MSAAEETLAWVEQVVVGLDLCPFARAPLVAGDVRIVASDAETFDDAVRATLGEVERLMTDAAVETTLLVFERAFASFEETLDAVATLEHLLEEAGAEADIQIVAFHPEFRFEGAEPDDPANGTNRSPYPMLHVLREASITRAVDSHPDVAGIPARNAEKLRALRGR